MIFISYFQNYDLVNIYYFIILIFLIFIKSDTIIFLFIALLPTNGFMPADYKLFGIINIMQLTHIFTILRIFQIIKSNNIDIKIYKRYNSELKIFSYIIIFSLAYYVLREFKFVLIMDESFSPVPLRLIKYILIFLSLYLLTYLVYIKKIRYVIRNAFLFSLVIISQSIIFSPILSDFGFMVGTIDDSLIRGLEINRYGGFFFSFGSLISAGTYLTMGIAYIIVSTTEIRNNKLIISLILASSLIGILFTVSRTPIISLVVLMGLYFLRNLSINKIPIFLLLFIIIGALFYGGYFQNILTRLSQSESVFSQYDLLTRGGTWLFYLDFFIDNPYIFFIGTLENPFSKIFDVLRSAHNFYLQLYFYGGIILYYFFIKIIKLLYKYRDYFSGNLLYFSIPVIFELMSVSELAVMFAYTIVLLLSLNRKETLIIK